MIVYQSGMQKVTEDAHAIIASTLRAGGVVVLRTDTIYGIVARADDKAACERVFEIKNRNAEKSCIVLIADDRQMWDGVSRAIYTQSKEYISDTYPTSMIVPIGGHTPRWIHYKDQTVAFRIPNTRPSLIHLLRETGPLIAPSANPEGKEPARSIEEAIEYFGETVDLYVDGGVVETSEPSHLYRFTGSAAERLR